MNRSGAGPHTRFAERASTDIASILRVYRERSGLMQREVARASGLGEKLVSAYECAERTSAIKLAPLLLLLDVYGKSLSDFDHDLRAVTR